MLERVQRFLTFNERVPYVLRDSAYRGLCLGERWKLGRPDLKTSQQTALRALRSEGWVEHVRDAGAEELAMLQRALAGMQPLVFNHGGEKAVYASADLAACYPFLAIATDDELIKLIATYLEGPPLIHALTVWDVDQESAQQAEMFYHVDYHGHRCVKLFIYLSAVEERGAGQHVYVARSHRRPELDRIIAECDNDKRHLYTQIESKRRHQGSFLLNGDVLDQHLAKYKIEILGPAGTSFLEDTRGLHRGTPITNGTRRRAFKVLYTALDSDKDHVEKTRDTRAYQARLGQTSIDRRVFERLCSKIVALG